MKKFSALLLCLLLGCGPGAQPQGQYVGGWAFSAPADGYGQADLWREALRHRLDFPDAVAAKQRDARLWGRGELVVFSSFAARQNWRNQFMQTRPGTAVVSHSPAWTLLIPAKGVPVIAVLDSAPATRSVPPELLHPMAHAALGDYTHGQYPLLWGAVDKADFDAFVALWATR